MLIIVNDVNKYKEFVNKYVDKINVLYSENFKHLNNGQPNPEYPFNYIEHIKGSLSKFEITFINYSYEIVLCMDKLKMLYCLMYEVKEQSKMNKNSEFNCERIILESYKDVDIILSKQYNWILIPKQIEDKQIELQPVKESNVVNKSHMTLQELLDEDVQVTESDVRDMKALQNKFKVGMMLQAKSMLNRVLKLSTIMDKLYDELLDRIDESIKTTDTASLMYTTEYISKALNETNQFIMTLINNDKIQNFFIIDNSTVINIADDRASIDERERIRKAAEVVLNNIDYFVEGEYEKVVNPNESEVQIDANSST